MSRASPLPRSGELSKAVMVGVTGSLRVDSDLPVPATGRPLVSLLQLFGDTKPNDRSWHGTEVPDVVALVPESGHALAAYIACCCPHVRFWQILLQKSANDWAKPAGGGVALSSGCGALPRAVVSTHWH
jgi:hypothetical protein